MNDRYYELWDLRSGNLSAEFDDEAVALRFLAMVLAEEGEASVASYGLSEVSSSPGFESVAGNDLVRLVSEFAQSETLQPH